MAFIISISSLAQRKELMLPRLPSINCFAYSPQHGLTADYTGAAILKSSMDSCFTTTNGVVVSIYNLEEKLAITIKGSDNTFFTYIGLSHLVVKENGVVKKGALIGFAGCIDDMFALTYIITDKKAKFFSDEQILAQLKKANREL